MTNTEWALVITGTIATLLLYALLWSKSKRIALILLLLAFAWFGYHGLDWDHLNYYFKVDWGTGGITPIKSD